jgi:maleylpyruvate isomerase
LSVLPGWGILVNWVTEGQSLLENAAAGLSPEQVGGPSRLPGWSRGHVLTHLSRNADALTNLLTWARTGVESPMYATPAEREAGIAAGAGRALPEQLADLAASGSRFLAAAEAVPPERRSFPLTSGQGRRIPAHEVPWLRVRELWLHLIDLDAGYSIEAVPDPVAWTLTRDMAAWMAARIPDPVDLRVDGYSAVRLGPGDDTAGTIIEGSAQRMAGWLTGRDGPAGLTGTGGFPDLPRWL